MDVALAHREHDAHVAQRPRVELERHAVHAVTAADQTGQLGQHLLGRARGARRGGRRRGAPAAGSGRAGGHRDRAGVARGTAGPWGRSGRRAWRRRGRCGVRAGGSGAAGAAGAADGRAAPPGPAWSGLAGLVGPVGAVGAAGPRRGCPRRACGAGAPGRRRLVRARSASPPPADRPPDAPADGRVRRRAGGAPAVPVVRWGRRRSRSRSGCRRRPGPWCPRHPPPRPWWRTGPRWPGVSEVSGPAPVVRAERGRRRRRGRLHRPGRRTRSPAPRDGPGRVRPDERGGAGGAGVRGAASAAGVVSPPEPPTEPTSRPWSRLRSSRPRRPAARWARSGCTGWPGAQGDRVLGRVRSVSSAAPVCRRLARGGRRGCACRGWRPSGARRAARRTPRAEPGAALVGRAVRPGPC